MLVRVQHHPSRAGLLPRILQVFPDAQVVTDPIPDALRPSAWRTYRECLTDLPATSHLLVLQDDALPCAGFPLAVDAAITHHPDRLVAFWHGGLPRSGMDRIRRACKLGDPFTELSRHTWVPTVALLWPTSHAREFLTWADTVKKIDRHSRQDDGWIGAWCRERNRPALATVPSLVEHDDTTRSMLGTNVRNGSTHHRVAALHIGDVPISEWLALLPRNGNGPHR